MPPYNPNDDFNFFNYLTQGYGRGYDQSVATLNDVEEQRLALKQEREALRHPTAADWGETLGGAVLPFFAGWAADDFDEGLVDFAKGGANAYNQILTRKEEDKKLIDQDMLRLDKKEDYYRGKADAYQLGGLDKQFNAGLDYFKGDFPGTDPYEQEQSDKLEQSKALISARGANYDAVLGEDDIARLNAQGVPAKPGDTMRDVKLLLEAKRAGTGADMAGRLDRSLDADLAGTKQKSPPDKIRDIVSQATAAEQNILPLTERIKEYQSTLPGLGRTGDILYTDFMKHIPGSDAKLFTEWMNKFGMENAVATLGRAGLSNQDATIFLKFMGGDSDATSIPGEMMDRVGNVMDRIRQNAASELRSGVAMPSYASNIKPLASAYIGSLPDSVRGTYQGMIFQPGADIPATNFSSGPAAPAAPKQPTAPGNMVTITNSKGETMTVPASALGRK